MHRKATVRLNVSERLQRHKYAQLALAEIEPRLLYKQQHYTVYHSLRVMCPFDEYLHRTSPLPDIERECTSECPYFMSDILACTAHV